MSSRDKNTLRHLTSKPFQLAKAPFRHWAEKRRLAQERQEAQRNIAEATNTQLLHFHEDLWSNWPAAAQHVRQHIRKEENTYE